MTTQWRAAGILATREDGYVLGFRREDDPSGVGLPCGGIEPGESPWQAAVRELVEETGYIAPPVHHGHYVAVDTVDNSEVHIFRVWLADDATPGTPGTPDEGEPVWVPVVDLLTSKYADFNRRLLIHFGLL